MYIYIYIDLVAHGLEGGRVVLVQERPQEAPLQLARRVYPFRQVGQRLAAVLDLQIKRAECSTDPLMFNRLP